jgi:hypothetical protein
MKLFTKYFLPNNLFDAMGFNKLIQKMTITGVAIAICDFSYQIKVKLKINPQFKNITNAVLELHHSKLLVNKSSPR